MGLFDELKKIGKDVLDNIQNAQTGSSGGSYYNENANSSRKEQRIDSIPTEFSIFPQFNLAPHRIVLVKADSYTRCSMYYLQVPANEISNYEATLISNGYAKNSNVRFDKENTYVIVDYKSTGRLNIVFHVKA